MANLYFRPGTWDASIWESVAGNNEYGLPDKIPEGALVLDVGAHIGAFTYAALDRGAGLVLAVEPDVGNAHLWQHNLHQACRAQHRAVLLTAACWRSDEQDRVLQLQSVGENTGGSHVLLPGGEMVRAVGLDAVIRLARSLADRPVSLLKLDCEGAEWPILFTCRPGLEHVEEIIGEYHPCACPHWGGPTDTLSLKELLESQGFRFKSRRTDGRGLGKFHAWRGQPLCQW